ncbi:MAG TPA: hypothetical protein VG779_05775 [Actinomycetota bacterium]|nr:hypothetical protein [Actinomycetota bacterium]
MIEDPDDRRPRELRIHGVGGSPGPRLLGFDLPTSVQTVGEGVGGTVVIARRDDVTVEGYDWGDLTSGSGTQPFWVLLMPFTVLNAAGWMHPTSKGLRRLCRATVHALSVLLSLTYVFSLALLLVDLVGYQWTRRVFCPNPAAKCARETVIIQQRFGVAVGLFLLLAAIGALVVIAGRTQVRFERIAPPRALRERATRARTGDGAPPEGLADPTFFWHPQEARRLLWVHLVALVLGWLAVGAIALMQMLSHGSDPALHHSLHLDKLLVAVNVPSAVAVGLLWLAWIVGLARRPPPGRSRWQPAGAGPAIAATMAYAPLVAVYSGTLLVVVKRLSDWPKRTMQGVPGLDVGGAVAFVDVWGGVIIAAALLVGVAALLLLRRKPHGQTDDIPDRTSQAGRPLDGADPIWCSTIASKRSVAWLAHQADWAALFVALGLWLTTVVSFLIRTRWFHRISVPANPSSPLYSIGAYVLALAPLFVYSLVRKSQGRPTVISTIWDVLTFLPRSFAPLAVRCYAERAVPEFQGRIDYHIRKFSQPVVISAHSQGSIIAFAAVASLPDDYARNVALVTYGSPITTIFGRFFPQYFGSDAVAKVRAKLPDPAPDTPGWRNFYRLTDPIGGRVFEPQPATEPLRDIELADPMPPPPVPWPPLPGEAPLEHDRPVWTQIAVHSYYLNEPELKHWVARLKAAMGTLAAPGGPAAPSQGDGTVVNVAKG